MPEGGEKRHSTEETQLGESLISSGRCCGSKGGAGSYGEDGWRWAGVKVRPGARLALPQCPFLAFGTSQQNEKPKRRNECTGWEESD